jgi:hypothetical protein
MHKTTLLLLTALLLFSCSENSSNSPHHPMQEIKGRDYSGKRFDVYRARVPQNWIRKDPLPDESIVNSKKSLCEFIITDNENTLRISIHNFPSNSLEERIPPSAQIGRWQRQFEMLAPEETTINSQAFNGYVGLKLRGIGKLDDHDTMILSWSLQIGNEHYRHLSHYNPSNEYLFREMRADVTIKAIGPANFMQRHEEEINQFVRSFELIEEIPTSS